MAGEEMVHRLQASEMVFNLLPDKRDTGLSSRGCGNGFEDGTDSATEPHQFWKEGAAAVIMAMTGSGNTRGEEMNPVFGKEFPFPGGKYVMIGCPIDHQISRIKM